MQSQSHQHHCSQHTSIACPIAPAAAGGQRAPELTPRRLRRLVKMQARKNEDTSTRMTGRYAFIMPPRSLSKHRLPANHHL